MAFGTSAQAAESSAVTVNAKDQDPDLATAPMPELSVTVSQTVDLVNQGLKISWTGGKASQPPVPGSGGTNFLQIFQCWGDLLDANGNAVLDASGNRQPDRTTCEYGAFNKSGQTRDGARATGSVAEQDQQYTVPGTNFLNPTFTAIPFHSATGDVVATILDGKRVPGAKSVNVNEFQTSYTTNEIPWAGSGSDGTGSVNFETQTALQSIGLGCGSTDGTGESATGKPCWLVVVPRGTNDVGEVQNSSSGLFWDNWKHRLAIRLDFRAIGAHCSIGATERQLQGSELVANAVQSWQPKLCGAAGGAVYSHLTSVESNAVTSAANDPSAPLALTSQALSLPDGGKDPLTYAPIALTGLSIAFAVDRTAPNDSSAPTDVSGRSNLPFTQMKLTPRVVSKLLTSSYVEALPYGADKSEIGYKSNADPGHNAFNLVEDPDFQAINESDWRYQGLRGLAFAGVLVPQGRSDGAVALWRYVLADADARAFLNGDPDPWGMKVNPWFSTNPTVNPTGSALELPADNYPKADPIESPPNSSDGTPSINLVTWRPFTNDYDTGGKLVLQGDGLLLGSWDAQGSPPKFTKTVRRLPGYQAVLSVTDLGASARYGVYTAALLNPAGEFVAPTVSSLTAAVDAMKPTPGSSGIVEFDPTSSESKSASAAYPLAMPVYAAARADDPDAALRESYASFIRYAVGAGQQPGSADGQLPDGYAPIPAAWAAAAVAAADRIAAGPASISPPQPPTSSTTTSGASSTNARTFAGGGTAAVTSDVDSASSDQPSPTGPAAPALSSGTTPDDPISTLSAVVPLAVMVVILAGVIGTIAGRRKRLPTKT
ncbi:hypothetical protein [uncultured Microbacterium sp.]|uniref:hypothetical protein n=1 Tax=uncultured Microbacterium sp. TaxID=191216 RepID=UPI0035C9D7A8